MNRPEAPKASAAPDSDISNHRYDQFRETVIDLKADDVDKQLPRLVETVVEESEGSDQVLSFMIGVSFSRNNSLLDYRLEKLRLADEPPSPRLDTLKPAVSPDQLYITFSYPPDPNLTPKGLRSALLTAIESDYYQPERTRGSGKKSTEDDHTESRLGAIWNNLTGR